jgi:4-hydroxy-tetrahydrodipicolinate reductase
MFKVALVGFGRTGKIVADEIVQQDDVSLVAVFKKTRDDFIGMDIGKAIGKKSTGFKIYHISSLSEALKETNPEVIIDFSTPKAVYEYIETISEQKINLVICSTNFKDQQRKYVDSFSDKIGIVWAPNITEGINILISLGKIVKIIWPDSDVEIIEYHFSKKKDVSKTALKIAEAISDADSIKIGRRPNEPRIGKETVIHTIRVGGIIGKHTIILGQPHQTLTITHESTDRHAFGNGALKAAGWVKGKKGIFSMVDVLDL